MNSQPMGLPGRRAATRAPTVGKDAKMRIVVIALPTSIVVPSVMGYAKVNAIAATASATTTTPAAQATLAAVRPVTLRPPTVCATARALAAWGTDACRRVTSSRLFETALVLGRNHLAPKHLTASYPNRYGSGLMAIDTPK